MKNFILKIILTFTFLISVKGYSCSCQCKDDCSFSKVSKERSFVALVKVIEYSDFLKWETKDGHKMPYSMTVEIIKKYKGSESRKRIKIWGDNGALCRPYINTFEVGGYYLIAPYSINSDLGKEKAGDFSFFSCDTDFLQVDQNKMMAFGEYSKSKNKISIAEFEKKLSQ